MTMLHTMRRLALGLGVSALVAVSSGVHAAGAPKKGGTLRYGTVSEIVSLDPHVYGGNAWKVLIEALYSPLVGYDKTGAVVPRLAQLGAARRPQHRLPSALARSSMTARRSRPTT